MGSSKSKDKVDAIFELRSAAEEKGRAENALDNQPTPQKRDALLNAQVTLEEKTLRALDACDQCGHDHPREAPHIENVLRPDFQKNPNKN